MAEARRMPWAQSPKVFLYAAGVGVIGGLVGTLFQLGSHALQRLLIGTGGLLAAAQELSPLERLLIPFGGATAAALLAYGFSKRRQSQGMADVMEAVSLKKAEGLSIRSTLMRATSSLALIATGGSVGREGPIVYTSAAFGARFAKALKARGAQLVLFAGCGVAAGMAAAYYAPLGAAIFTTEVVLGNFAIEIMAPVVVASVVASLLAVGLAASGIFADWMRGPPLYDLPHFTESRPAEYLLYLLLGVASAFGAKLFLWSMRETERLFARMNLPAVVKLPIGGLLVGVIGIWLPHVWGNGYDAVNLVLKQAPMLSFVALLFVMKIVATSLTVGSGGSGGIFTPTLFVGAALGLLLGTAAQALLGGVVTDPTHYAVVGMAAVLAATTHAPIMAIFILFEMTRETGMLLPMVLAAISASVASRAIGVESVYLAPLRRRGVYIPEGIEEIALTTTRVRDIMREKVAWIRMTATFDMIVGMVQKTRRDAIYVVDDTLRLHGVIRLHDVKNYLAEPELGAAIIATDLAIVVPRALPDQTLAEIMPHFDDPELDELPVVHPVDGRLLGVVDRRDLLTALSVEVLQSQQLRAKFVEHGGAQHYVEIQRGHAVSRIPVPREIVGQTLATADFRNRTGLTVLTVIHPENGRETRILPTPATVLHAEDALIVMGEIERIRSLGGEV